MSWPDDKFESLCRAMTAASSSVSNMQRQAMQGCNTAADMRCWRKLPSIRLTKSGTVSRSAVIDIATCMTLLRAAVECCACSSDRPARDHTQMGSAATTSSYQTHLRLLHHLQLATKYSTCLLSGVSAISLLSVLPTT